MPKVVKNFGDDQQGHRIRWVEEWFDGRIRKFERGHDFECSPESFRSKVVAAAHYRGLLCQTRVVGDTVYARAHKKGTK